MSNEVYRSTMRVGYQSMGWCENQSTWKLLRRAMWNVDLCGSCGEQDLLRVASVFPCCFWYCWASTWKDKKKFLCQNGGKEKKRKELIILNLMAIKTPQIKAPRQRCQIWYHSNCPKEWITLSNKRFNCSTLGSNTQGAREPNKSN